MKVVYERPTIYMTAKEIEVIRQTMDIVKKLGYEDEDIKLFDVNEDGFDHDDLYNMFGILKHIVEKRAKILAEDEID